MWRFANSGTAGFRDVARNAARFLVGGLTGAVVFALLAGPGFARSVRHQHRQVRHHHQQVHGGHGRHPARRHARRTGRHTRHAVRYSAPVQASILIDADTGEVIDQSNADALVYPASLAKMMTLYVTFEALQQGRLRFDQRLPVSTRAARQEPTKLWLKPGDRVRVRNLILGIVTRSANDAAVVLAEGIAGSEPAFAREMTAEAHRLGMTDTVYRNASGLPDRRQHTTAHDTARLALALYRDFPRQYHFFSTRKFDFRGKTIPGHDHLLDWYPGADGLKTGFIDASGFNLASSAVHNGHRLIGVIFGGHSARGRDRRMAALLDSGFAEIAAGTTTVAMADGPDAPPPRSAMAKAAARLASYVRLAPEAEAAPLLRAAATAHGSSRSTASGGIGWCIQLGAFRSRKAAERLAHTASKLAIADERPVRVVPPVRGASDRLYRTRVLHFGKKDATAACSRLKRKKMPCLVVLRTRHH